MEAEEVGVMTTSLLPIITAVVILLYIPLACYHDLRTRTFPFEWWLPMVCIGGAYLLEYVTESPTRNIYLLGLTVIMIGILMGISVFRGLYGADVIFAALIMLFVQYNPFVFPRVFFALDFFWTLLLLTVCLPIPIFIWNKVHRYDNYDTATLTEGYGVIKMFTHVERGFPYLLVISSAYVLTLAIEVLPSLK